jgi:hypothetical protein
MPRPYNHQDTLCQRKHARRRELVPARARRCRMTDSARARTGVAMLA